MPTVKMATAKTPNEASPKAAKFTIDRDTEKARGMAVFFTVSGNAQQKIDYHIPEARRIDGKMATIASKGKKGLVVIPDGQTRVDLKIVPRGNILTGVRGTLTLALTEEPTEEPQQYNVSPMTGNETEIVTIMDDTNLISQKAGLNEKTISTNANFFPSELAGDMNGDEYMDIPSTSWDDKKIAAYLNVGISREIESPQQIVFIDSNVDDYESLANGVLPGIKVVILDSSSDGFGQITRVIQKYPQISSIHIVSHGAPGCLYLGNSLLNVNNIDNYYSQKLEGWSVTNLFLYGCSVAAGDTGVKLLERIREITGANIAASARPTGNVALGGDWELEVVRGELEVDVPFTQETQQQWDYVLADPTPTAFDDRPAVFQIKGGVLKELNP